ncbi:hypothetical protein HMPREF9151_00972 [Hoylesella saccharolytica F0055]|uniref:Uncharacterized protein n=1 Tax=Hoylesella saccharolytica F0055 TaxID=1127699 RepID=L1NEA5_9BACT|nr:hypothetical protein HMPREF9151_00972 [Hoylesella saccharolytica F0055]
MVTWQKQIYENPNVAPKENGSISNMCRFFRCNGVKTVFSGVT